MVPHLKDIKLAFAFKNHALSSRDKLVLDLILRSYLPFQAPILPSFLSLHYRWWQKAGTDLGTRQLAKTHLLALRSLWSVCMLYFAHVAIYASPCCLQYSTIYRYILELYASFDACCSHDECITVVITSCSLCIIMCVHTTIPQMCIIWCQM